MFSIEVYEYIYHIWAPQGLKQHIASSLRTSHCIEIAQGNGGATGGTPVYFRFKLGVELLLFELIRLGRSIYCDD